MRCGEKSWHQPLHQVAVKIQSPFSALLSEPQSHIAQTSASLPQIGLRKKVSGHTHLYSFFQSFLKETCSPYGSRQRALLCAILQWSYWSFRSWFVLLLMRCRSKKLADPPLEFLEFDFRVVGDGRSAVARYANNSNYRNDALIRKESVCIL